MAEPYSDAGNAHPSEEAFHYAIAVVQSTSMGDSQHYGNQCSVTAAALQKLIDQRDEARRVARVLAKRCEHGTLPRRDDVTRTALAYPEVPHG